MYSFIIDSNSWIRRHKCSAQTCLFIKGSVCCWFDVCVYYLNLSLKDTLFDVSNKFVPSGRTKGKAKAKQATWSQEVFRTQHRRRKEDTDLIQRNIRGKNESVWRKPWFDRGEGGFARRSERQTTTRQCREASHFRAAKR